MSDRGSSVFPSPRACSGDMNGGVPTTSPSCDSNERPPAPRASRLVDRVRRTGAVSSSELLRSRTFARPQSMTYTSPKRPTITLPGLRSRWMMPRPCAYATVRHTLTMAATARERFQPPRSARARSNATSEVEAVDVPHGEVRAPVGVEAHVVHRHDAGMVEARKNLRLLEEAGQVLRARPGRAVLIEQHLHGQRAVQHAVPDLQDGSHTAPGQLSLRHVALVGGRAVDRRGPPRCNPPRCRPRRRITARAAPVHDGRRARATRSVRRRPTSPKNPSSAS